MNKKHTIFLLVISLSIAFYAFKKDRTIPSRATSSSTTPTVPTPQPSLSSSTPPPPGHPHTSQDSASSTPPYQNLQRELLRFHHPDTRLTIKTREVLSDRKHRVLISYTLPDGRRNSFQAILDTKENTLPSRWGRTIHEKLNSPSLLPNGKLFTR